MKTIGIRGATTVARDTADEVVAATEELLEMMSQLNGFGPDELTSIFFTVTDDVRSTFPARAARKMGWTQVPMLCAREIPAGVSVDRCIRVLIHRNVPDAHEAAARHVYLRQARALRPDWAQPALSEPDPPPQQPPKLDTAANSKPISSAAQAASRPTVEAIHIADISPVAFQGEPGAFSQEALHRWAGPDTESVPSETFRDAFLAVSEGRAASALLPIENSTTGSIHPVYDLLLEYPLTIQAEVILPVRHVLMAPPGTTLRDIREVASHPQALAQCSRWIASHGWEPVAVNDTAGAARALRDAPVPGRAAIASRAAAALYGLDVVTQDVQDVVHNYTRFLLLAPGDVERPAPTKTSIIFATRHVAGDLYACLAQFAVREINLTKIESRPDRNTPWNYLFHLDFEGHPGLDPVREALASLERHVSFVRLLGSYASTELR